MPPDAQLEAERARQALLLLCKCGKKKPGPFHECCAECWSKKKRRASMKKKALRCKWSVISLNTDGTDTSINSGSIITPQ